VGPLTPALFSQKRSHEERTSLDEFTGDGEYLNVPAAAIRDIHEAVG